MRRWFLAPVIIGLAAMAVGVLLTDVLVEDGNPLGGHPVEAQLVKYGWLCLDNPLERILIRKLRVEAISPPLKDEAASPPSRTIDENHSDDTRPALARFERTFDEPTHDATLVAYTLFAIPLARVAIEDGGFQGFESCKRL